ncbi:hypothetical protein [Methanobacterium sp.]|uniref:hypothetical protein n=1 Tax=Methanobacterium sp. TaxID=2164 RepID=UPI0025E6A0B1|nr:hypothetical protein [Methanobacterium sp.]MBI5460221.1 hypothetical protein [Methanobacterium sp.]
MSTVQVEVLRREAAEEERKEIERIREKYKERKTRLQYQKDSTTLDQEKQALIQQAEQQEQQEKEQIKQKYKQRQKNGQLNTTNHTTNQEIQALIQQAELQEKEQIKQIRKKYKERQTIIQQEKEQIKQELKPNKQDITTKNIKKEDLYKKALNREVKENNDIWERFLIKSNQDAESFDHLGEIDDKLDSDVLESENLEITELKGETEELKTVDRSAILAKYSITDIQEDDVNRILENFDRPIIDDNIEEIEEKIVSNIKRVALSHPKIEWVNVLVFLDDKELEGNIKIFAEYDDGSLLKRIISEDNKKLEVELIQIALYEVWDVFTTLGVNIDDLESKIDVEIELDKA